MDDKLVAVWAHILGAMVAVSVAVTANTANATTTAVSFGHSCKESGFLLHDEIKLLLGIEFHV